MITLIERVKIVRVLFEQRGVDMPGEEGIAASLLCLARGLYTEIRPLLLTPEPWDPDLINRISEAGRHIGLRTGGQVVAEEEHPNAVLVAWNWGIRSRSVFGQEPATIELGVMQDQKETSRNEQNIELLTSVIGMMFLEDNAILPLAGGIREKTVWSSSQILMPIR